MSLFRSHEAPPPWCTLRSFEIIDLAEAQTATRRQATARERLLCTGGTAQIGGEKGSVVLKEGQFLDIHEKPGFAAWTVTGHGARTQLVRLGGSWGQDMAGCGIFRVAHEPEATNNGDPVSYPKSTRVDSHYHDCDEYWLILEGRGTVVVGGRFFDAGPGDCVALGMGHHHDMASVSEPVKAVFFETSLEGRKRVGHLWNHTHGPAQPQPERI
ncbi:cupin domain-containing protein [Bosea sp. (in: a-proteobacteria)]|uniref:cupin domain-containing protein n=1 Tax=Bosea sp. (in: a-proteobacteria) TaxID=1871050 RepID=UPI002617E784|nr:cupin domain-containing protein [Bosea sp. (in: a-proteobacteria)]MCO5090610.1 cupin domain-containing protein [Bosea sp. (in: a-proteobacteria)]